MPFTKAELEEMRRADEEIEREFRLEQADLDMALSIDRLARFEALPFGKKKVAAQRKAYREANREKVAAQRKAYYEANREKWLVYNARKRAKRAASDGD